MANKQQLTRLQQSITDWNTWREQHPNTYPNLNGVNLRGANLRGVDFTQTDLRNADLFGANLDQALLSHATLRDADLREVSFHQADLNKAELSGADLSEASLNSADLNEADLSRAVLSRAVLRNTDLSSADLSRSNLNEANLRKANLSHADLRGADLNQADLTGADLTGADLTGANLNQANLSSANLDQANFYETHLSYTIFAWVDLCAVEGLDEVVHIGPSTVNINTVLLPHEETTRMQFLQGVGFTEQQIDYLPSLLTPRPIQYHSLFISYASQDKVIAQRLHTDLRKKNIPCWFAPHDLQPGNYVRKHIDQAIHTQDKVVLLLSQHAIESGWVEYEVELALQREIAQKREILFPLRLDDAIFAATASWACSLKDTRHIGDFTGWQEGQKYQDAFACLLRQLKTPLKELRKGQGGNEPKRDSK